MDAFVAWVRATSLSQTVNTTIWIWPAAETIHFIGLSLLIGIVGFFDLRLMGFFRGIPISAARQLMPFALIGFLFNLFTGLIFLIGLPEQYRAQPRLVVEGGVSGYRRSQRARVRKNDLEADCLSGNRRGHARAGESHRRHIARHVAWRALLGTDAPLHRRCVLTLLPPPPFPVPRFRTHPIEMPSKILKRF